MFISTVSGGQESCAFTAVLIFSERGEEPTYPRANSWKCFSLRRDMFAVCGYVRRKTPEKKFNLEYIT